MNALSKAGLRGHVPGPTGVELLIDGAQPRKSACATASRAQELERLRRMSIEARIGAALSMGARYAWLKPAKKGD